MSRLLAVFLVLLSLGLAATSLATLAPLQAAPVTRARIQQPPAESPCLVDAVKHADPSTLLLGERAILTLRVTTLCPNEPFPLHIVLVLDASAFMAGARTQVMKDAAADFVGRLDLPNHPETEIGVVEFHRQARTMTQLTNDERRVISAINRAGARGRSSIELGINEGLKVLLHDRGRGDVREVHEVMIVLSGGANYAGCPPVLEAANKAHGLGVLVVTICLGPDCDTACMRDAATSPRYYYEARDNTHLPVVFDAVRKAITSVELKRLRITDVLPDNMLYVPGSAQPAPKSISPSGDVLEWETAYVPNVGVTYTLEVEPLELGDWPTNVEAKGTLKDNQNRESEFDFPAPWLTVLRASSAPSPTAGPSPTPTHAPTPTASPTATPTRTPGPVYMPIVDKGEA